MAHSKPFCPFPILLFTALILIVLFPLPSPVRIVGFFYDDDYVGEKPDERLRRSPVTSRLLARVKAERMILREYKQCLCDALRLLSILISVPESQELRSYCSATRGKKEALTAADQQDRRLNIQI